MAWESGSDACARDGREDKITVGGDDKTLVKGCRRVCALWYFERNVWGACIRGRLREATTENAPPPPTKSPISSARALVLTVAKSPKSSSVESTGMIGGILDLVLLDFFSISSSTEASLYLSKPRLVYFGAQTLSSLTS